MVCNDNEMVRNTCAMGSASQLQQQVMTTR